MPVADLRTFAMRAAQSFPEDFSLDLTNEPRT